MLYKGDKFDPHLIGLHPGDWERIASMYRGKPPTVAIRELIRKHIEDMDAVVEDAAELAGAQHAR